MNELNSNLPNQFTTALTISSCAIQSTQRPVSKFTTKKGSQQNTKTPDNRFCYCQIRCQFTMKKRKKGR